MQRLDGAAEVNLGGGRFVDFFEFVVLRGVDWSAQSFEGQLRLYPDAPGDPLARFLISPPRFVAGNTEFEMSLARALMRALPDGAERGDDAVISWDLVRTVNDAKAVVFFGTFTVYAGTTQ